MPSIHEVKAQIARELKPTFDRFTSKLKQDVAREKTEIKEAKQRLVARQREERAQLRAAQDARSRQEHARRLARFRNGWRGLWDRVTGRHATITQRNEAEFEKAKARDQGERDALTATHLASRQRLQYEATQMKERLRYQWRELKADRADLEAMREELREIETPERKASRPRGPTRER